MVTHGTYLQLIEVFIQPAWAIKKAEETALPFPYCSRTKSINCGRVFELLSFPFLSWVNLWNQQFIGKPKRLAQDSRSSSLPASYQYCRRHLYAVPRVHDARPTRCSYSFGPAGQTWNNVMQISCNHMQSSLGGGAQTAVGGGEGKRGSGCGYNVNDNESLCSWQLVWWATGGVSRVGEVSEMSRGCRCAQLACTAKKNSSAFKKENSMEYKN